MQNDFDEHLPIDPIVGNVLALRAFRIDVSTQTLGGLSYHQEIVPGINVAQCAHHLDDDSHPVPNNGCTCGWYAYDEVRHWGFGGGQPNHSRPRPTRASGIVRLSGRVIVCNRGLKAENLEIVALTVHPQDESTIEQLFPDVELFDDEAQMIKAYPLTRLDRHDPASTVASRAVSKAATWFTRTGPIATFAVNQWQTLTVQATFSEIIRWVTVRLFLLGLGFYALYAINDTASTIYPPGSAGGFGPLIPLAVLVLLSPIMNLWKSIFGLLTFLILLHHGLVNSAPALESLIAASDITNMQSGTAVVVLYAVPGLLLLVRLVMLYSRFRDAPVSVPGKAARGGRAAAMGRAGALPARAGLTFQQNRLPKKTKTVPSEGPDNNAQES